MFAAIKRGSAFVFLSAARAKCSPLLARRIHSFRIEPKVFGKLGALSEKRGFRTRNKFIKNTMLIVTLSETK